MKLNPKLTGGLAWAGLILILAVPSADMLTKPQGGAANTVTSDVDAIRTASVETTGTPALKAPRSVAAEEDKFAANGDEYPSYIVDVPEGAAKRPATTFRLTAPGAAASGSTSVATAAEPEVAPIPQALPAWRIAAMTAPKSPAAVGVPALPETTTVATVAPVAAAPTVAAPSAAAGAGPLIIDEELVARREAAVARVLDEPSSSGFIDEEGLEEWDSGSLADYLDRKGLLAEGENQQASADDDDDDGFWLDGRDGGERRLVRRVERRNFFFF